MIGVMLPVIVGTLVALFGIETASLMPTLFAAALWMLTAILYGTCWFALVSLLNASNRNAAANGLIAAVCWITFVVLIPALAGLAIEVFTPPASSFRFTTVEREASLEINSEIDAAGIALNLLVRDRYPVVPADKASQERYYTAYFYEPVNLPKSPELITDFVRERPEWQRAETAHQLNRALLEIKRHRMKQRLASVLEESNQRRNLQANLSNILDFASPSTLTESVFSEVSGGGNQRHENFLAELANYVRNREGIFNFKILNRENFSARSRQPARFQIQRRGSKQGAQKDICSCRRTFDFRYSHHNFHGRSLQNISRCRRPTQKLHRFVRVSISDSP